VNGVTVVSEMCIEPCLPSTTERPPSGSGWIHEIKHDGFRLLACRGAAGVRLLTRNGTDFTARYPLIVEAVNALPVRSCVIDGEAVACDGDGLSIFEKLRWRRQDGHVFMLRSTYSNSTARTCGASRLRCARPRWQVCCDRAALACNSTSTWSSPATSSFATRARWASKASCRSGWDRATFPAARATGSSSKIHRIPR
jgi:ATP dependent DNA ligase domain